MSIDKPGILVLSPESSAAPAPPPSAPNVPVILENELDQQRWAWLQAQCDAQAIRSAFERLGRKRPYVKNLATALGLSIPSELGGVAPAVAVDPSPGRSAPRVPVAPSVPTARPGMGDRGDGGARGRHGGQTTRSQTQMESRAEPRLNPQADPDQESVQVGFRMPRQHWLELKEFALHNRTTLQAVLTQAAIEHLRLHRRP